MNWRVCSLLAVACIGCGGARTLEARPRGLYRAVVTSRSTGEHEVRTREEVCLRVIEAGADGALLEATRIRVEVEGVDAPAWRVSAFLPTGGPTRARLGRRGQVTTEGGQADGTLLGFFGRADGEPRWPASGLEAGTRWQSRRTMPGQDEAFVLANEVDSAGERGVVLRAILSEPRALGAAQLLALEETQERSWSDGFAGVRTQRVRISATVGDLTVTGEQVVRAEIESVERCATPEPPGPTLPPAMDPPPADAGDLVRARVIEPPEGVAHALPVEWLAYELGGETAHLMRYRVPGLGAADEVAFGVDFGCARLGAEVRCWGEPIDEREPSQPPRLGPVRTIEGTGPVTRLFALPWAMCARSDGWRCWGYNPTQTLRGGERLFGGMQSRLSPTPPEALAAAEALAGRSGRTLCGRFADGRVLCRGARGGAIEGPSMRSIRMDADLLWGVARDGVAHRRSGDRLEPFSDARRGARPVAVDHRRACWLGEDSVLRCGPWDPMHPVAEAIAVAGARCLRTTDGRVRCWGSGPVARGAQTPDRGGWLPLEHVTELSAADRHVCARTEGRAVYCWGRDFGDAPVLVSESPGRLFSGAETTCHAEGEDLVCVTPTHLGD